MFRSVALMITFVAVGPVLTGCEQKPGGTHHGHHHAANDGHGHDEHAGHQHPEESDRARARGEALELGSREAGEYKVAVVQFGPASDGFAELVFEIEVDGAQPPDAVRVLVRNTEGAESLKVKANKVADHTYDVHAGELPANLGAGGTVVVEIESASRTESVEFAIES